MQLDYFYRLVKQYDFLAGHLCLVIRHPSINKRGDTFELVES